MQPAMLDTMAAALRHAVDPVAFAAERLDFAADDWQADVLRSSGQNILLNCSRQAGKSTTTAIIALHEAYFRPDSLVCLHLLGSYRDKLDVCCAGLAAGHGGHGTN